MRLGWFTRIPGTAPSISWVGIVPGIPGTLLHAAPGWEGAFGWGLDGSQGSKDPRISAPDISWVGRSLWIGLGWFQGSQELPPTAPGWLMGRLLLLSGVGNGVILLFSHPASGLLSWPVLVLGQDSQGWPHCQVCGEESSPEPHSPSWSCPPRERKDSG